MKKAIILLLSVFLIAVMLGCDETDQDNGNSTGDSSSECTELEEYPHVIKPNDNKDTPFTGPYNDIIIEGDPEFPTHTIIRPRNLDEIDGKLPVLAWGEGGCVKFGRGYAEMMGEVASYGIIVIADGGPELQDIWGGEGGETTQGSMMNPTGVALTMGIDYAFEKNDDPCSPLYQKVDTGKVAVSGQSCGGLQAIDAASDPRVTVTFIMSSGLFSNQGRRNKLPKFHTPVIYLNGGPTDVAYTQATKDIDYLKKLNKVPVYWANRGIGHMADILQDNGGTFGTYITDWMRYQFFGERSEMFLGDDCGYCEDDDHESEQWTLDKFNGAE